MVGYDKKNLLKHSAMGFTLFLLLLLLKNTFGTVGGMTGAEPTMPFEQLKEASSQVELRTMVTDCRTEIITLQEANRKLQKQLSIVGSLVLLLLITVGVLVFNISKSSRYKQRTEDKNHRLQAFLRRKYEISRQYVDDNEKMISKLTQQLNNASKMMRQKELDYMELQKQSLELKNEGSKLANVRISTSLALIRQSECAMRFCKAATDKRISLSKADWHKLSELVLQEFPLLMQKIDMNPAINDTERKVVLLALLDMGTLELSSVTGLKTSTISSAKRTAYEKLSGMAGSTKDLSKEIINIIATSL